MSYHHFTPEERKALECLVRLGMSKAKIGETLKKDRGTIRRELKRNLDLDGTYQCEMASVRYFDRRKRCYAKSKRKLGDQALLQRVQEALKKKWSPEQIAGRWRDVEYPKDPAKWISHETIYRYVRADKAAGGTLYRYLRRGHKRFNPKAKARCDMGRIQGRTSITERPAVVAERSRIGDWEGDTMYLGRQREQCLATLVERQTRFLKASFMPDSSAAAMNAAITRVLGPTPEKLRCTLTVDNGKEFAGFKGMEQTLGLQVYFAHPYRAWERALNENTNGLLRQYFPKKASLLNASEDELQKIVDELNDRPRKKLQYQTPRERFSKACDALDS